METGGNHAREHSKKQLLYELRTEGEKETKKENKEKEATLSFPAIDVL